MGDVVKVENIEVFTTLRAAVAKFAQTAENALSSGDSQVSRMHSWLENEQTLYWNSQLRRRHEELQIAKDQLRQKKLYKDVSGRIPNAMQEEKVVAKCQTLVDEANAKLVAIKKALPRLEKENDMYRSGTSRLGRFLTGEIPKAMAALERMGTSLDEYLQIATPQSDAVMGLGGGDAVPETPFEQILARPPASQDTPPAAAAAPAAAPVAAEEPKAETASTEKEAGHVLDG